MWRRPGACTITVHLSRENQGQKSWALLTVSGISCPLSSTSESSHAPCLQGCSDVAWCGGSRGVADAMIEAQVRVESTRCP